MSADVLGTLWGPWPSACPWKERETTAGAADDSLSRSRSSWLQQCKVWATGSAKQIAKETNGAGGARETRQVKEGSPGSRHLTLSANLITGWRFWHVSVSQAFYLQRRFEQFDLYHFIVKNLPVAPSFPLYSFKKRKSEKKSKPTSFHFSHWNINTVFLVTGYDRGTPRTKGWLGGREKASWTYNDRNWNFQI